MSVDVKIFTQCDHFTGGKQYIVERCPKCGGKGKTKTRKGNPYFYRKIEII